MFCQLFDNMCPIVSLPYSQTAPNTCLAYTEHFDLSPFIVIGGPGLVIHGPFDCWHVKCSVPIPKAEIMSFVFSCLTYDLRTITGSSVKLQRLPLAHLAAAWEMCGPRPPSEMSEKLFCQIFKMIPSDLWLFFCKPCVFTVLCAEKFPVFVWGPEVQLICVCPLSEIFIPAVRRLWVSCTESRGWSVAYLTIMYFLLY